MAEHRIGTQQEWQAERHELLREEKELTRRGDELTRKRRELRRHDEYEHSPHPSGHP